jgi:hypothetical protein
MLIRKKMIDHDLATQKLKRKPPKRIEINSKL